MWGSHRSSRNGICCSCASNPRRSNRGARSKDINTRTEIGEGGSVIAISCGANSYGQSGAGGGVVASVCVVVSCSDSNSDSFIYEGSDCIVYCNRFTSSKRHVSSAFFRRSAILTNPVDSTNNPCITTASTTVKYFYCNQTD